MCTIRVELLAMREVRVRLGSFSSCVSSMNFAEVNTAPRGVRRSWPRMARNISLDWSSSCV